MIENAEDLAGPSKNVKGEPRATARPMNRHESARLGGLTRALRSGGSNEHLLKGLEAKFLREVDPDGVLTPQERERRARIAKKLFYTRIQIKSAQARSARRNNSKDER
jgi:hypothetical protein